MTVLLGRRTDGDKQVRKDEALLAEWKRQWGNLYQDLMSHCWHLQWHRRRVVRLSERLQDAELLITYPEGSAERTEAQDALWRHNVAGVSRYGAIVDQTSMFPSFWDGRPKGVDEWLTMEWWSGMDEKDVVLTVMPEFDPVWNDVVALWERRTLPVNAEECPY